MEGGPVNVECAERSQIRGTDPQRGICRVCGHTTCVYQKPCDMCRMEVRVAALENAVLFINRQDR
jgi:ribosomal protein S14